MTIEDLKAFVAVYKTNNVSNAAVMLQMTQSALSKRLKSLQQEVNAELISTTNRRNLQITESGETFYHYAQQLLSQYNQMRDAVSTVEDLRHGSIRVGSVPVMSQYGMMRALTSFMHDYPEINIQLQETEGQRIVSALQSQLLDAIIIRDLNTTYLQHANLTRVNLLTDELVVILPANHPLAKKATVSIADLADNEFTSLPQGSGVYETLLKLCKTAGFTPAIHFESTHIETILSVVTNSHQCTLLFKQSALPFMTDQLVMRALTTPVTSQLQFIYDGNQQNAAVRRLLQYIQRDIRINK
ncbi:MAG TPA: transcriptional regulator [Lactobacillus sp.]|nr:transcriptional regulator [Lactobacillus sp.]